MEFPYGCQPHHHHEELRKYQQHQRGFQPSPDFPRLSSAGEYYPPLATQFPGPGYYSPSPQPQPYSQVEYHAHRSFSQVEEDHAHPGHVIHHESFSQVEEYHAHQCSGQVIHYESHQLFQSQEYKTPSGSLPRPSGEPSEESFTRPSYGSPRGSFPRPGGEPVLPPGQVVKVFCKADPNFSLAIREGSVVLVHVNASDKFQQWVQDLTYSTRVRDEANSPSFSLVNRATGQALKHGLGETQPKYLTYRPYRPRTELLTFNLSHLRAMKVIRIFIDLGCGIMQVLLTEYQPNTFDESTLWTMSGDMGQGYKTIRLVNNISLNLDAFRGDEKSGGIKDGNPVVLWSWKKGENQLWKIVPH